MSKELIGKELISKEKMPIRLNKYLANSGLCSRRQADRLIEEGKVMVNGSAAYPGMQVSPQDQVIARSRVISHQANKKVVLAFYKPIGVTCTEQDRHAEKKINDVLQYPLRVTYAGRLDKDSEGLLLMTNDGILIERMMRGSNGHEKEYLVKVNKEITNDFLSKMQKGIFLKELQITTRPCRITVVGKFTFKVILTQGVNRQIRRMCKELGFQVNSLKRIRVVNVELAKLKAGEYRELAGEELRVLYQKCGLTP